MVQETHVVEEHSGTINALLLLITMQHSSPLSLNQLRNDAQVRITSVSHDFRLWHQDLDRLRHIGNVKGGTHWVLDVFVNENFISSGSRQVFSIHATVLVKSSLIANTISFKNVVDEGLAIEQIDFQWPM